VAGRDRRVGVPTAEGGRAATGEALCYPVALRVGGRCEAEPNGEGGNGEESARRQLLPRRGDGVGGATEFAVRGGALMVGAVEKAMGRGLARGVLRSEDGKRVEARWRPFEWGRGEAGERGSEGGRRDHSAGRRHRLTGGPEQHSARRCEFKLDSKYFKRIQICPKL
jgi:hypothetical protein